MIHRELSDQILKKSKGYPVVSITGPRQSGKTTLAKSLYKNYSYYNLENPETRRFAEDDPQGFLKQDIKMVIDEIQRVPELFSYIQVFVDEDKKRRYVLTGSQNFLISEKISQSLAGRVAIFKLPPFTMQELRKGRKSEKSLEKQIFKGFYPRLYSEKLQIADWYDNYIQTYLERDVRLIKNIGQLSVFHKFLSLLAGRTGQILNMSTLANDTGVSVPTIDNWISILETSYIIYKLQPFYKNLNKRIIRSPKIYFYDTGLVCALLNINTVDQLKSHPLIGSIFESFIVSELIKRNLNDTGEKMEYYYFREKTGKEVDILYEREGSLNAVEIKYGKTVNQSFFSNLYYFKAQVGDEVNLQVVYGGEKGQKRTDVNVLGWKEI